MTTHQDTLDPRSNLMDPYATLGRTREVPQEEPPVPVPLALVEHLERKFPDRMPERGTSPEDFLVAATRVEMVRYLRQLHKRSQR